jgi:hypothetical protein
MHLLCSASASWTKNLTNLSDEGSFLIDRLFSGRIASGPLRWRSTLLGSITLGRTGLVYVCKCLSVSLDRGPCLVGHSHPLCPSRRFDLGWTRRETPETPAAATLSAPLSGHLGAPGGC